MLAVVPEREKFFFPNHKIYMPPPTKRETPCSDSWHSLAHVSKLKIIDEISTLQESVAITEAHHVAAGGLMVQNIVLKIVINFLKRDSGQ